MLVDTCALDDILNAYKGEVCVNAVDVGKPVAAPSMNTLSHIVPLRPTEEFRRQTRVTKGYHQVSPEFGYKLGERAVFIIILSRGGVRSFS